MSSRPLTSGSSAAIRSASTASPAAAARLIVAEPVHADRARAIIANARPSASRCAAVARASAVATPLSKRADPIAKPEMKRPTQTSRCSVTTAAFAITRSRRATGWVSSRPAVRSRSSPATALTPPEIAIVSAAIGAISPKTSLTT